MPVSIPLDKICVRSGILCPRCQSLVDRGVYDELDVEVMRALISLEGRLGDVNIKFVKTKRINNKIILFIESDNNNALPSWLGKEILASLDDPRIRDLIIMPSFEDPRELLEYIIKPYRIIEIKKVYLPDGSLAITITLPSNAKRNLEGEVARIVIDLLKRKYNGEVYIEFVDMNRTEQEKINIKKPDIRKLLGSLDRY